MNSSFFALLKGQRLFHLSNSYIKIFYELSSGDDDVRGRSCAIFTSAFGEEDEEEEGGTTCRACSGLRAAAGSANQPPGSRAGSAQTV